MIYVIEYNYPSKMLVEHINNYLEKKRVRNLPVKLVYNGNISYIDYDLKNIYFFSCQGNSGINAYKELERIRRNDPFGRIIVHSNKVDGRRLMDHKLQVYGLMELRLSDYGKPDLYYQELDFLLGDLYEELWEMAAEAKYAAGKKTNQLFPRWGPEIGIYPPKRYSIHLRQNPDEDN